MLVGNRKTKKLLDDILVAKDHSHAYLFVGSNGVGKTSFATDFAKSLVCESDIACGTCGNCLLFDSGNHPDVIINDSLESITVDQMRGIIENLSLKPYQAAKKVLILANAERMTTSAANSLLKTLEEPTKETVVILTANNHSKLLPTITSRVQQIKFNNLTADEIKEYLKQIDCTGSDELVEMSLGRPNLAERLANDFEYQAAIKDFLNEFDLAISSEKIWEKLKLAEKIAKKKEDVPLYLDLLESFYERKLKFDENDQLKISTILDKLTMTRELLSKNVNQKLVFEALLLGEL